MPPLTTDDIRQLEADLRRGRAQVHLLADSAHQARHDRFAAIGKARNHDGKLQRRCRDIALADADAQSLAVDTKDAVSLQLPSAVGDASRTSCPAR